MDIDDTLKAAQLVLSFAKDSHDPDPLQRLFYGVTKAIETRAESVRMRDISRALADFRVKP